MRKLVSDGSPDDGSAGNRVVFPPGNWIEERCGPQYKPSFWERMRACVPTVYFMGINMIFAFDLTTEMWTLAHESNNPARALANCWAVAFKGEAMASITTR